MRSVQNYLPSQTRAVRDDGERADEPSRAVGINSVDADLPRELGVVNIGANPAQTDDVPDAQVRVAIIKP